MAYIVSTTDTATATAATYAATLGAHVANDLLAVCLSQDTGTTTISLGSNALTSVTSATDVFVYSGTDDFFDDGIQVEFSGTLGTSLTANTRYWVRDLNVGAQSFRVSATNGGGVFDVTGSPSGVTAHRMTGGVSANNNCIGWEIIGTQAASQACRQVWAYKVASGAGTATPTFTGTNASWISACLVIRDAHASPIEGWMRSDWGNSTNISTAASNTIAASSAGGTTVITPSADSLVLYSWNCDGASAFMRTKLSDSICDSKKASATLSTSHIVSHTQLESASIPNITMYAVLSNEGGNGWVLSIKNVANGTLQKQARAVVTENASGANWYGNFGATQLAVTWARASTFVAAAGGAQTINGITASDTALGTITITNNPQNSSWGSLSAIPNGDNAVVIAGACHAVSSTNLTGKIFCFSWQLDTSSTSSRVSTDGILVGFSSADNVFTIYQVASAATGWTASELKTAILDINNASTYATGSGGGCDFTAVVKIGYLWHRGSGSATVDNLGVKNAVILNSVAITGGSASVPANFQTLTTDLPTWTHYRIADLQGSSQVLGKFPVQIGDGSGYTYFDSSASSFEFPTAFSSTQKDWNINTGMVSLSVYAKSGDTVTLAAGVAATATAQAFTINASSAAFSDATYSFAGESIVGFTPTDSKGLTWSNTTFKSGGTVTIAGGGDLTNCTVSNTTSTNAALAVTANGTVLDGCTIDGTGAAYAIELGTAVTAITLTDCTLTAGSLTPFDKIHVLKTTGTVTITISGTTSLAAGDVTTAGAAVFISAPQLYQVVVVSGFTAGSRIQIYDTTSSTELFNGTASAGDTVVSGTTATWTDPTAAAADRAIRVRVAYVNGATAKLWQENTGLTCGQTSGTESITYPITQVNDTTYNSNGIDGPAIYATSGITFTDAATDLININIVADTVALKTIYACFVYWLFTAAGIDDDVAYIDAVDPANYIMTSMKIRNTSTDPLKITDGYFYDSTGSVENCVDVAGSSGNIYPMPVHVVAYQTTGTYAITGDISTVLAAIPSDTDNATAVLAAAQTTPIHSDVRKVVGITVDGTGTDVDPWGPV